MKKGILSLMIIILLVMPCLESIPANASDMGKKGAYQTIAANAWNMAAIKNDGSLWTCGDNYYGQLGDGTTTERDKFINIMSNMAAVSVGRGHMAAVRSDGTLWIWGKNTSGQLGNGTTNDSHKSVKVLDNVTAVSAGDEHTVALKTDGTVWAWGWNLHGQVGNGTTNNITSPVKVMEDVVAVSAGFDFTAAIKSDGSLYVWGNNGNGQCADGTSYDHHRPTHVMDDVAAVSAGTSHIAILKNDGSLWTSGANYSGQLGIGTVNLSDCVYEPVKILDNVKSVYAGAETTVAIKDNGTLWICGSNCLEWDYENKPQRNLSPEKSQEDIVAVALGNDFIGMLDIDGRLMSCGSNEYGQLGVGYTNRLDAIEGIERYPIQALDNILMKSLRSDALSVSVTPTPAVINSNDDITVTLDNKKIIFDQPPIIQEGRTLVPMRAIFEAMGMTVEWNDSDKSIKSTGDNGSISMNVGNTSYYYSNGHGIYTDGTMDVPPMILNGRTLVPVRVIAESTGYTVDWDGASRHVIITSPNENSTEKSVSETPEPPAQVSTSGKPFYGGTVYAESKDKKLISYTFDEDHTLYMLEGTDLHSSDGKTKDNELFTVDLKSGKKTVIYDNFDKLTYSSDDYEDVDADLLPFITPDISDGVGNFLLPAGEYSEYIPTQVLYNPLNGHIIINGYFSKYETEYYNENFKGQSVTYDLTDNMKLLTWACDKIVGFTADNTIICNTDLTTYIHTINPCRDELWDVYSPNYSSIYVDGNDVYRISLSDDHDYSVLEKDLTEPTYEYDRYNAYRYNMITVSKLDIINGKEEVILSQDGGISYGIKGDEIYMWYADKSRRLHFSKADMKTMKRTGLQISMEAPSIDWLDAEYVDEHEIFDPRYFGTVHMFPVSDDEIYALSDTMIKTESGYGYNRGIRYVKKY